MRNHIKQNFPSCFYDLFCEFYIFYDDWINESFDKFILDRISVCIRMNLDERIYFFLYFCYIYIFTQGVWIERFYLLIFRISEKFSKKRFCFWVFIDFIIMAWLDFLWQVSNTSQIAFEILRFVLEFQDCQGGNDCLSRDSDIENISICFLFERTTSLRLVYL